MTDTRFDVYFSGQLVGDVSPEQAAERLAQVFRTQPERLAHLFTGKPVAVKRNVSREEAVKYRQVLGQVGMTSLFREHGAPAPSQSPTQSPTQSPAHAPTAATAGRPPAVPEAGNPPAAGSAQPPTDAAPSGPDALTLAPVDSDVLKPSERRQVEPLQVDLSGLSLAPPGADLLRPEERAPTPAVDIDTSGLGLA